MKATEIIGRPILDLATATTIGKVGGLVFNAGTRRVAGFRLARRRRTATGWRGSRSLRSAPMP